MKKDLNSKQLSVHVIVNISPMGWENATALNQPTNPCAARSACEKTATRTTRPDRSDRSDPIDRISQKPQKLHHTQTILSDFQITRFLSVDTTYEVFSYFSFYLLLHEISLSPRLTFPASYKSRKATKQQSHKANFLRSFLFS